MKLLTPFHQISMKTTQLIVASQVLVFMALWMFSQSKFIPTPVDILTTWNNLAQTQGLLQELLASSITIAKSILLSTAISLLIASLGTMALFKNIAKSMTAFRFLGFAGITFFFTLWTSNGADLKLWLLTFGMTVFMLTNVMGVVDSITQRELDYARTIRLSPARTLYELFFRGKLADILDLVRQNAAIGWVMLSMVEGLVRSEGGIGAMLLNQNRYFNLSAVFAIQITILLYGILQDYIMQWIRLALCPHVALTQVKG